MTDPLSELTIRNRDAHLPDFARSLSAAGHVALTVGEITEQSIHLAAEGVRYYEELAAVQPEVFDQRRQAAAETLARLRQSGAAGPDPDDTVAPD